MFNIALYEPEIPPNTGNIIRLCANTGCTLHLIHPLGFSLDEKQLRRAGMDYRDLTNVVEHENWQAFESTIITARCFAFTTRASKAYDQVSYQSGDTLLFGPETRGLPETVLQSLTGEQCLRLPMAENSRSLNLSNTVSIATYEALRQHNFPGLR